MKRSILILSLLPALSFGAPFDLLLPQRNIADSATITRTASLPALNASSVLGIGQFDNLPAVIQLGSSMAVISDKLECGPDWISIVNKPMFSAVATSGNYNDLTNKPSVSAQVNSDWSAVSGPEQILNKPTLFSGAYADLTGKPAIPTVKRTETFTGNTDSNGLITVTYSPAYPSVPSIQPGPPPSSDMSWVLVSSTTTGFSIRLVQRSVLTVLSVQVLAGTVTNVVASPSQVLVVGQ